MKQTAALILVGLALFCFSPNTTHAGSWKKISGKLYGNTSCTNANEVEQLVEKLRPKARGKEIIWILSGTHGTCGDARYEGTLDKEDEFYQEDKWNEGQTIKAVNVGPNTAKNTWKRYLGKRGYVILAWCCSTNWEGLRTYGIK